MNNMQKSLLAIFLPITILILIFDHIYPTEDMVQYLKYTIMITLFRNYFNLKISRVIALSSILMFICDMGVAFSVFHPVYSKISVPWFQNIIWAAYIPGWTLLAIIISEKNLRINVKDK